jgi:hypothetical protein
VARFLSHAPCSLSDPDAKFSQPEHLGMSDRP